MTEQETFNKAIDHAMLYEVGGFWNVNHPAVAGGLIDTKDNRRAVGYVNDSEDTGGETKFGVAKNANPDLNITGLTWEQAKRVYYRRYWLMSHCDELSAISPEFTLFYFDAVVNHGVGRAAKFLQQAVGVTVDGDIGPKTIAAVQSKIAGGGYTELIVELACIRKVFYNGIVTRNPSQAKFIKGWLGRVDSNVKFATAK